MNIPGFTGEVLAAGDDGYEQARRVWNGVINRHPAVIARCHRSADIAAAIGYARDHDLPIAVRGGGHGVAGPAVCEGGLVVDCSPMRAVRVDPGTRTIRAAAGCLWADVDRAGQQFGLAVPGGIVSHTGIAGLTLGGGIGWLMRKHGLTADNLLSAEIVTADGGRLRCGAGEHEALLWALRGGGGNFGIVTAFEYRAHPVGPTVLAGPIIWPLDAAPRILRFYRQWIREVPSGLTTIVKLARAPALPAIPAGLHGRRVVIISCCYAGPLSEGTRVLRPLRALGVPCSI